MTKAQKTDRDAARDRLRTMLPEGSTVWTVVRHVARSGMSREISLHKIDGNEILWLSGLAATALGYKRGTHDGVKIGGCGMDMTFAIVHELSRALYGNGEALTRRNI